MSAGFAVLTLAALVFCALAGFFPGDRFRVVPRKPHSMGFFSPMRYRGSRRERGGARSLRAAPRLSSRHKGSRS